MTTLLSRVHRGLFFAVAGFLMISTIAPALAVAQESTPEADLATETTAATEPVETPAPQAQGVPWAQPVDYGVVINNLQVGGLPGEGLAVRTAPSPDAEVLGRIWEGQRVEVTSYETWSGDTPYVTINYGNGGGYVNAFFIQLDSQAPVVTEEPVVTEAPVTEVPVETVVPVTEAPVTEVPVETETAQPTEVVTEVVPTEAPSETAVPVEGTPAPTNEVQPIETTPVDGAGLETPTNVATSESGTPAAQPSETTVATDEASATPDATETATETEAATETEGTPVASGTATEGTPVASETATETEGTPVASEAATETATVTPEGPDLSKAIGSATVTGTNGEGIRCRVAADDNAATIVVLSEGTVVSVFDTSTPGWLQISCGGQLGYGDINYLYTGGASDDQINQGGRLTVSGTGGGGLNCRSGAGTGYGVIALIPEGTALTIRGQASNGWTPVTCGGQNGYVYSQYIAVSQVTDGGSTGGSSSTGTASVTGTGGDGVRCRTSASTTASVIMVVNEGVSVIVRGASSNGWTPVTCGGQNGYISSTYLGAVSGTTPGATQTPPATATSTPGGSTGTGWVTVTGGGGGVNCRSGAGTSYGVIALIAEGAKVQTRSGSTNGWQAVICGGKNGFILGELTSPASGGGTGTTPTPTATATSTPGGGSGSTGTAVVANTGGDGVYCRSSAPSGSPITVLAEGTTVTLRGTANNGWQPVICGGQNGFVSSQFLSLSNGGGSNTPTPAPGTGGGLVNGDHAKTTAVVNLRYSPSMSGAIAMSVEIGIVVQVTGAASGGFYPISYDGLNGWISGDYLVKTSDALSKRGGSANPGTTPTATTPPGGGGGGSATGNALVSFAMGYLGYPYVSATHGPASFDCSGFTYWVVYNVTGQNIWYGLWTQISAGTPVDRGSLQPGDLVFFQNTYQAGLSHVGIYIGGDQFIHAENEDTGVRISSLSSTYYSSRYYGARRIG